MRIIDISQPIRVGMPVWPGDQPFEARWSARIADGSSVNVGAVTMSLHTGTHADAPLHVSNDGASIDQLPLDAYFGPAIVVEAFGTKALTPAVLDGVDLTRYPRVLFKTRRQPLAEWEDEFAYLSAELAEALAVGGARLVGLDTSSVDHAQSKDLHAHHILFMAGIVNLENLRLDHVAAGSYELAGFPLAIDGMDASPVRAVLID